MKKTLFIKLSILFLAVSLVLPQISSAQSLSDLQAEITALLAQVQSLQQQLAGTSSASWCHEFSGNLSIGQSGAEITALQAVLQKDGESVNITGSFDDQTASAVTGFQEKYASDVLTPNGLSHGTGYVGSSTRAKLNSLFGCSPSANPPTVLNPIAASSTAASSSLPIHRICPAWGCGPAPIFPVHVLASSTDLSPTSTASSNAAPLAITSAPLGGSLHIKSSSDNLGAVAFSANNAGLTVLNSLKVTFGGSGFFAAGPDAANFLNSVQLIDQNGNSAADADGANIIAGGDTVSWTFPDGFQIPQGPYEFTLRADTTQLPGTPGVAESLNITIQNDNDIQYTDSAGTAGLGLPASAVPFTINSTTYPLGE
jgi:hypothetical protein